MKSDYIFRVMTPDHTELARAYSRTAAIRIAKNKLGTAVGGKEAMEVLAAGCPAWVHASKVEGCASLLIVPAVK